jgi:large subunit ribosomal protein L23
MNSIYEVLLRPLITEKSTLVKETQNKVSFVVAREANKQEISKAVETIFKVKVTDVKTCLVRGKMKKMGRFFGKRPNYKKAIVTLAEGYKIDFMGGA